MLRHDPIHICRATYIDTVRGAAPQMEAWTVLEPLPVPCSIWPEPQETSGPQQSSLPFFLLLSVELFPRLALAGNLEPVGPAVFSVEPGLAVSEAARHTALALGRVGAVEEWNVLVANITEPGTLC